MFLCEFRLGIGLRRFPVSFGHIRRLTGKGAARSIDVCEISPLLGAGPSLDRLFMLWCIPHGINNTSGRASTHTMRPMWKALTWSMVASLSGRWPRSDWNNRRWDPISVKWHKIHARMAGQLRFPWSKWIGALLVTTNSAMAIN